MAQADSPIASQRYLADPAHLIWEDRVYLYASNDDDNRGQDGYQMASFVCVSSSDMKNWTDHGEVFRVPRDANFAQRAWAPAMIEKSGTIYMYFGNNAGSSNVATATSPLGPFQGVRKLVDGATPGVNAGAWYFDPAVFIDDDGQAYLYFGGNSNGAGNDARVILLNEDMVSVTGSAMKLTADGGSTMPGFFEASWMHKRGDVYYFSYSSPGGQQNIDYASGPSPTGPFTFKGTVGPNPPGNNNNNHHAIFQFGEKWYEALHNRDVAQENGDPPGVLRNLAIEELTYADDGDMNRVVYTEDGVEQLHPLNPYERVEAETTNRQSGIETEVCEAGGMNVTDINDGDWIKVRGVDFLGGAREFSASIASSAGDGTIELRLGDLDGMVIGNCDVPATGGDQTWELTTCDIAGAVGENDLYLVFSGQFNFDYWQFTPIADETGSGGANSESGGASGSGGDNQEPAGGATGTGGSTATGGSTGTGGTSSPGSGGGDPLTTGGASINSDGADAEPSDTGGCSCRLAPHLPTHIWWPTLALVGAAYARRRSRMSVERR